MRFLIICASMACAITTAMGSFEAKAEGRAVAPDGLSTLKSEYPIPGGRPLLFCGEKFMVVLIVGFVYQEKGKVIPLDSPMLQAIRKDDIEGVQLPLDSGARIQFREADRRSIDTWTDARAILECLD